MHMLDAAPVPGTPGCSLPSHPHPNEAACASFRPLVSGLDTGHTGAVPISERHVVPDVVSNRSIQCPTSKPDPCGPNPDSSPLPSSEDCREEARQVIKGFFSGLDIDDTVLPELYPGLQPLEQLFPEVQAFRRYTSGSPEAKLVNAFYELGTAAVSNGKLSQEDWELLFRVYINTVPLDGKEPDELLLQSLTDLNEAISQSRTTYTVSGLKSFKSLLESGKLTYEDYINWIVFAIKIMSFCEIHHYHVRQYKKYFYEIMLFDEMKLAKKQPKKTSHFYILHPINYAAFCAAWIQFQEFLTRYYSIALTEMFLNYSMRAETLFEQPFGKAI